MFNTKMLLNPFGKEFDLSGDYIDLAKMLQLVPVIRSVVGAVANYRLKHDYGQVFL
ncbi:MAG: EcsC family protein [Carboxydocellales bacterium]